MRLPDIDNLRRKLRKLRRDPALFVYDFLRPRIEARPAPESPARRRRSSLVRTRPATIRQLDAHLGRFSADLGRSDATTVVVIFSATTAFQDVHADRSLQLARMFRRLGAAVVFSFSRWNEDARVPSYAGDLLVHTPIDYTIRSIGRIASLAPSAERKLFVVGFPFPELMGSIDRLNASGWSTIYDCSDDWEQLHQVGQAPWYAAEAESFAVNRCDLTCCPSKTLVAKMASLGPDSQIELSPNACDDRFRSPDYTRRPAAEPVVGYFADLSDALFDWPKMIEIARHRPAYRFEIIGRSGPKDLELPPNVELLGPRSASEICDLAGRWRAAILPFKMGQRSDGLDPIEIYQYLALGLPTVSFRMPQIENYPYTTAVTTVPGFARGLDAAVATDCDPTVIESFLAENSWENRAEQLLEWADTVAADPFKKLIAVESA